jgi:hypothetical protein
MRAEEGRGTLRKAPVRCVQPRRAGGIRMGKPTWGHAHVSRKGGEPDQVKHLSSPRKREDSASSGERTRKSPVPEALSRTGWQARPEKVTVQ